MLELVAIAVLLAQSESGPSDTWEAVEADYRAAIERFVERRTEDPSAEDSYDWSGFRERCAAFAERGEGRAVVWLIDHVEGDEAPHLLELVEGAGAAAWVGSAVHVLAGRHDAFDRARLEALLEKHRTGAAPGDLRAYAALARARVVAEEDAELAGDLRVWAAMLRHRGIELELGAPLAPEDLALAAQDTAREVQRDSSAHFALAFAEGSGGMYFPRPGAPPDPEERWRPAMEELARRGARSAMFWCLSNSPWQLDDAAKEHLKGYLQAVTAAPLSAEEREDFSRYEIGALAHKLGIDAVESCVRGLIDRTPESERVDLVFGLGDALCARADEDAGRMERGLALLREVGERWPDSDQAKDAAGRIFRFTKLQIGMPCPDFETVDADGAPFKLSDYEGKVTVVDFWGFW